MGSLILAALCCGALTLDAHVDIPVEWIDGGVDPSAETAGQFDLPAMERGGLDAAVLALFAPQEARDEAGYRSMTAMADGKLAAVERLLAAAPTRIALARDPGELELIHASGRRALILGILNASVLGSGMERLDVLMARGVRQVGLVHLGHNDYADSSRPSAALGDGPALHGGMSPLGLALVDGLNERGLIVDVSQLSSAALTQACARSRAPVIASHSAVRARVDNPRNLTDDELRLVAATGGVIHVVAFSNYLKPLPEDFGARLSTLRGRYGAADDAAIARLPEARRAQFQREFLVLVQSLPRATLDDFVQAIDHVVRTVGIEHVGIASDFNHGGGVQGFMSARDAADVTAALARHGYPEADIARIWSGNYLRVWRAVRARGREPIR